MMTISSKTFATLLLTFLLASCGQSGPLYLPGDPSEVQSLPTQLPPTTSEEDDEEKKENDGN
jgi:predicted small lipoprotein YifL